MLTTSMAEKSEVHFAKIVRLECGLFGFAEAELTEELSTYLSYIGKDSFYHVDASDELCFFPCKNEDLLMGDDELLCHIGEGATISTVL